MYRMLKKAKPFLTKQQYRTIRGQIIAGDVEGAKKGLKKLLKNGSETNRETILRPTVRFDSSERRSRNERNVQ